MAAEDGLLEITDANFEQVVLAAHAPVLVDFGADWCPDCRVIKPTLAQIARDYAERVLVGTVDTDAQPRTAARFRIGAIPTLILFVAGREAGKLVNVKDIRRIADFLDGALEA